MSLPLYLWCATFFPVFGLLINQKHDNPLASKRLNRSHSFAFLCLSENSAAAKKSIFRKRLVNYKKKALNNFVFEGIIQQYDSLFWSGTGETITLMRILRHFHDFQCVMHWMLSAETRWHRKGFLERNLFVPDSCLIHVCNDRSGWHTASLGTPVATMHVNKCLQLISIAIKLFSIQSQVGRAWQQWTDVGMKWFDNQRTADEEFWMDHLPLTIRNWGKTQISSTVKACDNASVII